MNQEPLFEEQRTTPDSINFPIWGRTRGDRFFPWMTASHVAMMFGWKIAECGPNVSPDGSVLIHEEEPIIAPEIERAISEIAKDLCERLRKTIDEVMTNDLYPTP